MYRLQIAHEQTELLKSCVKDPEGGTLLNNRSANGVDNCPALSTVTKAVTNKSPLMRLGSFCHNDNTQWKCWMEMYGIQAQNFDGMTSSPERTCLPIARHQRRRMPEKPFRSMNYTAHRKSGRRTFLTIKRSPGRRYNVSTTREPEAVAVNFHLKNYVMIHATRPPQYKLKCGIDTAYAYLPGQIRIGVGQRGLTQSARGNGACWKDHAIPPTRVSWWNIQRNIVLWRGS